MNETHSATKSKAGRVYDLFLSNPYALFSSDDIKNRYYELFSEKINPAVIRLILIRLMRKNKLLRTKTQTDIGYIYSLKNQRGLDEKYKKYLVPYELDNKKELINLMLWEPFEQLKTNHEIPKINTLRFVKKYGKEYLYLFS